MELIEKIEGLLNDAKSEAQDFYLKGNGSAGTRARKALFEIKKLCDDSRKDISKVKNERAESKKK